MTNLEGIAGRIVEINRVVRFRFETRPFDIPCAQPGNFSRELIHTRAGVGPEGDPVPIWSMRFVLGDAKKLRDGVTACLELNPAGNLDAFREPQQRQQGAIKTGGRRQIGHAQIDMIETSHKWMEASEHIKYRLGACGSGYGCARRAGNLQLWDRPVVVTFNPVNLLPKKMKKILPLLLCALLLAACHVDVLPIESGFTGEIVRADGAFKTELTPDQIKALSEWFAANQNGWKFNPADFPPGTTALILKHRGGRVTGAYLIGNKLWVGNRVKLLTASERSVVEPLFNPNNHLPVFVQPAQR